MPEPEEQALPPRPTPKGTPYQAVTIEDGPPSTGRGRTPLPSTGRSYHPPSTSLRSRRPIKPISLDSISSPRGETPASTPRGRFVADEPELEITIGEARELEKLTSPPRVTKPASPPVMGMKSPSLPRKSPPPFPEEEISPDEELTEEEELLMLTARLKLLKRDLPEIEIPEPRSLSLKNLRKLYQRYKQRFLSEQFKGTYQKWLIAFIVIIEVVGVRILEVNLSGFAVSQLMAMNSYQTLLLELADKYGKDDKSYFPVELRLAFAVGLNTVIFYLMRNFCNDTTGDMARTVSMALGGNGEGGGMAGMLGAVMNMLTGGAPAAPPASGGLAPPPLVRRRKEATEA